MLQLTHTQVCPAASASRSVSATRVNGLSALVSFYFGYWFSHWRA
ncbi:MULTISPECIES: hypothetical protein [Pseudomonas]|jgi:hypothetical protein|uniref:Hypothetical membrane protein n=1 Tax=Pseudomonas veronii 1YdBTEX2 TaxID=1295141 RepID=A0A1D3K073_PSEVE|nr:MULTISPECIES: hypothetical protein [Pseudomonas]MCT9827580.1 hypothetical protein [Pseudomonas veronii]MDF3242840.1 hypothetical protein [Pseudomonas veronii]MDY7552538.1 hypothetical protein [Pseudomonas sp. FG1]MEB0054311.1 hypothetical protein [Pseudomonas sp. FG1]WRU64818.1 hypothetical protein VPH48_10545 [Pseudomonas veronii]